MAPFNSFENIPGSAAKLKPYLMGADELHQAKPVASFYFRYYCLRKMKEIYDRSPSPELKALMNNQLSIAEDLKQTYPSDINQDNFTLLCHDMFKNAKNEEQANGCTPKALNLFIAAGLLLDVLTLFGPLVSPMDMMKKYAKWRATMISRGEGLPPDEQNSQNMENPKSLDGTSHGSDEGRGNDLGGDGSSGGLHNVAQDEIGDDTHNKETAHDQIDDALPNEDAQEEEEDYENIIERRRQANLALQQARYAVSALIHDDVQGGIEYLQQALRLLSDPNS